MNYTPENTVLTAQGVNHSGKNRVKKRRTAEQTQTLGMTQGYGNTKFELICKYASVKTTFYRNLLYAKNN